MSRPRYDSIGSNYTSYRRSDPRIAAAIHAALGDAQTVANIGAGSGSYEPTDRPVISIDPSTVMALQRDPTDLPAVLGVAESVPLADKSVDAALAVLTMHHWSDIPRGLSELVRVARRRVVTLTADPEVMSQMWLFRDYAPELAQRDQRDFPSIAQLTSNLGGITRVIKIAVPADCADGFLMSFWSRPEDLLNPSARAATSGFARLDPSTERRIIDHLQRDLRDGRWDCAHGHLRGLDELDVGLRLTLTELPQDAPSG